MDAIVFVLLAAALIGVAFYLVALPLIRGSRQQVRPAPAISEQERLTELLAQRDSAFQALRELSFDYKVGKITDEDFAAFEANLKQNAANTLRALDQWEVDADADLDAVLEDAILTRRAKLSMEWRPEPDGRACGECGRPALEDDKFCSDCGAALPVAVIPPTPEDRQPECPNCGQPTMPADKFCARCGAALPAFVTEAAPAV